MAAVAKVDPILVSPPGEWAIDKGWASEDIEKGDPIVITSDAPPSRLWEQVVAKATGTEAHGIALKDCMAGGTAEYAAQGEMDGFTGLTRGQSLSIVDGVLDTDAPTITVDDGDTLDFTVPDPNPKIRAVTTSRIRFFLA